MKKVIFLGALLMLGMSTMQAKKQTVTSPNGRIVATLDDKDHLTLSVSLDGETLMKPSKIGITTTKKEIGNKVSLKAGKSQQRKETITAPFYRQKSFNVSYTENSFDLGNKFSIVVRAYNDGVAYRFATTETAETVVKKETAAYNFGKERTAWLSYTTNDEKPYAMAFQNIYDVTTLDTAESKIAFLPATVDCGKAKMTLLESDVWNYPCMFVKADGDCLKADIAPYPKKMEYYPWRHMSYVAEGEDYIAKSTGARNYPWRIMAVTEKDTEMPVNNLVYALATPNKIGDTSWIRPGKVAWDWWNDWNLRGVDFETGINYDTYKYYIDFASKNGIEYVVLDEGWYNSKEGDIMNPIEAIQFEKLLQYAKSKNVGIVLWAVFNVMDENLETICKHYAAKGIKGFKVDFMDRNDQTAVEMVERLADCCAKNHLLLDLHGIYTPVGLNRTYPNVLNYESVFGMEESRWTTPDHDMPLYDVTFPYTRMMAGQVDFTPGAMRNGTKNDWKAIYTKPISMGTRCHQLACYIVQDSPFTMLADTPTNYERETECTNFICGLPVVFDATKILQGEMGKYIVTLRKKGQKWYMAGQTNWDGREVELSFDFLPKGKTYNVTLFKDGVNAGHDAEDYKVEHLKVNKDSKITVKMASGGGFAMTME